MGLRKWVFTFKKCEIKDLITKYKAKTKELK